MFATLIREMRPEELSAPYETPVRNIPRHPLFQAMQRSVGRSDNVLIRTGTLTLKLGLVPRLVLLLHLCQSRAAVVLEQPVRRAELALAAGAFSGQAGESLALREGAARLLGGHGPEVWMQLIRAMGAQMLLGSVVAYARYSDRNAIGRACFGGLCDCIQT